MLTPLALLLGPHGNCNFKNKRFIQLISPSLWFDICKFFPEACPIVLNQGLITPCVECENEMSRKMSTASDLFAWALNAPRTFLVEAANVQTDTKFNEFHVVYQKDIEAVDEIVDLILKAKKRGSESLATGAKLKSHIVNILYRNMNIESEDLPTNVRKQLSFSCEKHLLPVASLESLSDLMKSIPIEVRLVSTGHYNAIHASLLELETILFGDDVIPEPFLAFNPIIVVQGPSNGINPNFHSLNDLVSSILENNVTASWKLASCNDKCCYDEYLSKIASMAMTDSTKSSSTKKSNKPNDNSHDIFIVDDDSVMENSNALLIDVHEFDGSIGTDRCLSAIEMELCNSEINGSVRRSRRKHDRSKKVFSFYESKKSNLAQMRLRVYEKSENKNISSHQLSVFGFTDDSKGIYIELPSEWNERSLDSILSSLPVNLITGSKLQLILNSRSSVDQSELGVEDNEECDDSMFDMLLQLATGDESPQAMKRGKRRRQERGFSGTFLQSSFSIPSVCESKQNGLVDQSAQEKSSQDVKENEQSELIDLTSLSQDENEDKDDALVVVSPVTPQNDNQKIAEDISSRISGVDFASTYTSLYDCSIDTLKTLCPLHQTEGGNIDIPPVPNWNGDIDKEMMKMIHDVENLSSSTPMKEGDGNNSYFYFRHDRILRNFYRNFVDEKVHNSSKTSLSMSRREMDIILFYIFQEKTAEDCRECLIPYRTKNSLRLAFREVKQQRFDEKTYAIYNEHVNHYVKELETKERTIQLIDSVASDGS